MHEIGLFLLSAATLAFEVNLTRVFAVSQFYHFAFMTVSLALLGFGASGVLLSLAPGLIRRPTRPLPALSWGFALTAVGSYVLTQQVPFDSYRVFLDPTQWATLALHYLALSVPFLCAGTAVGLLLMARPEGIGRTYAANLVGSAAGCLLAVTAPAAVGAEGMVLLAAALAALAGLAFTRGAARQLVTLVAALALFLTALRPPAFLEVRLSPYKGLSYALRYPDARLVFRGWNGFSRVDVVEATPIRSLPGQGFTCIGAPPPQRGLFVDGDDLSPITRLRDPADLAPLTDCLLTALPYRLRPGARTLVVDPRGGFDLWVALAEGAERMVAVEPNPLVVRAVRLQAGWTVVPYDHPQVDLAIEEGRSYLARSGPRYDVILFSLPATYHPVTSGAYSLAENYRETVEGFVAALDRLEVGGLLVVVRWLQTPPSESVRAFGLAVTALERVGEDPAQSLVALRSYNQMLILARRGPFTDQEVEQVRRFAEARSFDLVYVPDIRPDEVNRFNVLPSPDYYRSFAGLLKAEDREAWLAAYPYDVSPPTDDRPFFGHFFRWSQVREVLAMAGHVWQPFGGAGYLVILGLLAVATAAAGVLVLLPLAGIRSGRTALRRERGVFIRLIPFGFLGVAYLFVEIPLLQRFILFLGQPAYSMATVLGALLLFSGLGSLMSTRVRPGRATAILALLVLVYRLVGWEGLEPLLGMPLAARLAATVVGLAPLGLLMGIPFPALLTRLQGEDPGLVPWAWGVNGAVSVVASVLAALTALSWGLGAVLAIGAACYLGAWLTGWAIPSRPRAGAPPSPVQ
jgi:spermidine synthase